LLNNDTEYRLLGHRVEPIARGGMRQVIELAEVTNSLHVELHLELFPGHPVIRHTARVKNLHPQTLMTRGMNFLPWEFDDNRERYQVFRVNQWVIVPREANFETAATTLNAQTSGAVSLATGSGGTHCAWLALRDAAENGLFAGLEFDGRATFTARHLGSTQTLRLSATVNGLNHPVAPGETIDLPGAFVGLFTGDWDEAGFRTQRFAEDAIAVEPPGEKFPYVAWDSWGYEKEINETVLRQEAEYAAALGVELFIVDLGWAKRMGDWRADPEKFPNGLKPLSDYVHSLGMKFGLHYAFSEADPESEVLAEHPDWTSSQTYYYHGGLSLCLGHKPARDWIIEQGVAMIKRYGVDWILQDGQTLVKNCNKQTHTHHPGDSNWANSVDGLNVIIAEITRRTGVLWENCANGGSMMTFNMMRQYVTSITNDASGARGSRQGAYGATYPFPPRYTDRYMSENRINTYATRSYMFGGPWILMNRLSEASEEDYRLLGSEIAVFKQLRQSIRDGKVGHLTARPAERRTDAIESYNARTDTAIAIVTRDQAAGASYTLRFRDLEPSHTYRVRFQTDTRTFVLTGLQLMNQGVAVRLPDLESAEIVYAEPMQ
jgi:hypothetical protein